MSLIPTLNGGTMTGKRKLALAVGIFVSSFVVASVALFYPIATPRATFAEWAMFIGGLGTALKAIFVYGNVAEHRADVANGKTNGAASAPPAA